MIALFIGLAWTGGILYDAPFTSALLPLGIIAASGIIGIIGFWGEVNMTRNELLDIFKGQIKDRPG